MKRNSIITAIAAALALTSAAVFLLGTKKGRKFGKELNNEGEHLTMDVKSVIGDAKKKFEKIRTEMVCKQEKVSGSKKEVEL
ncbi:MAG: hypothetical protein EOO10_17905 [Chitinophagaceae bacterium]|nr:MAG: hypothetical protein EOO10_17905 [Chitinophagaceae bacterium]